MKALVGAFNQEKALVGPVVEPMDRFTALITGLAYLENMMKRSAGFGELRHYLLATLQPLYDRLGFQEVEGEKFLDEKLRIIMLEVRCDLGTCRGHVATCAGAVPPGPRGVQ